MRQFDIMQKHSRERAILVSIRQSLDSVSHEHEPDQKTPYTENYFRVSMSEFVTQRPVYFYNMHDRSVQMIMMNIKIIIRKLYIPMYNGWYEADPTVKQ